MGVLYELESQLETMKDEQQRGREVKPEHLQTIKKNLPSLTAYCGIKPYDGNYDYASLRQYMKDAGRILNKRGNELTLRGDRLMADFIRQNGKAEMLQLKQDNYNLKLEEFVAGADQGRMLDVVDNHFVPRAGLVFLTPKSNIGRAPFYSSIKNIGPWTVKTLWFNLAVMLLMSVIVIVLLITKIFVK